MGPDRRLMTDSRREPNLSTFADDTDNSIQAKEIAAFLKRLVAQSAPRMRATPLRIWIVRDFAALAVPEEVFFRLGCLPRFPWTVKNRFLKGNDLPFGPWLKRDAIS